MLLSGLVWLVACRSSFGDITLAPAPVVPSVLEVSFPAPDGATAEVVAESDGDEVRAVATVVDGRARGAVIGLVPDEEYVVSAVVNGRVTGRDAYRTPAPPEGLEFEVQLLDPLAEAFDGFVMLAVSGAWSGVVVVDGTGKPRWWVASEPGWSSASPRPTRDGRALMWLENDVDREEYEQRLVRVELDGSRREIRHAYAGHHMIAELDGGEFAWPSWDIRTVPWDAGVPAPVLSDRLLIGDGLGEPRELLSFFDDRGPAYVECSHGLELDSRLGQPIYEWTHTNSVVWLEDRDVFVVTARLIDSILEVDRQTGDVHWQLGGRDGTLDLAEDDRFSHGHMSDAWDGGLLMFDNGVHSREHASRVIEYAIDPDSGTAQVVWDHPDAEGRFYSFLGDARRMPSGDVLIAWSTGATIEEVSRDHVVRWRLSLPAGGTFGRMRFFPTFPPAP